MSQIKVILKKSLNGVAKRHKQVAVCLGLRKIGQSRQFKDSPAIRGQLKKIQYLLVWEKV